jgi:hypothetical protein
MSENWYVASKITDKRKTQNLEMLFLKDPYYLPYRRTKLYPDMHREDMYL